MDLKSGLNEVKNELSSDEKLLEQAFQLERFFKKYKVVIITIVTLLVLGAIGYKVNAYLNNLHLERANSALLTLEKDPKNKKALSTLKENNPKLYALYSYSQAVNSAQKNLLQNVPKESNFLKDVINYHKSVLEKKPQDSIYYKNLVLIEKAYLLIKEGKKAEAKNYLSRVPRNSQLAPVARLLKHYTIQ